MPTCPVCDEQVNADEAAFTRHVNAHFDEEEEKIVGGHPSVGHPPGAQLGEAVCWLCGKDLNDLNENQRNEHVSFCLDREQDDPEPMDEECPPDEDYPVQSFEAGAGGRQHARDYDWDGAAFASHSGGSGNAKKDMWWDPLTGGLRLGDVPANFAPGLIPVLHDILSQTVEAGTSRRAVLSRQCVHIKGAWGYDGTWGCGYRNAMMSMSALLLLPSSPYIGRFKDPGVRNVQGWVEEAWRAGFDQEGKQQLKGKLVGTSKWIGTTDLYAMFSFMGVPCTLYDFRKPESRDVPSDTPAHKILERWVMEYFDEDEDDGSQSDDGSEGSAHQGHSRTIVGYELGKKGDVRLLLFDPGKTVPRDVRDAGLASARAQRSKDRTRAIEPFIIAPPTAARRATIREGAAAAEPSDDSDVEIRPGGWVRRKVDKAKDKAKRDPLETSLSAFRATAKKWGPAEYQVLAFSGGPLLSPEARAARKHVTSTPVDA